MNPIGGFFELELNKRQHYHTDNALRLNLGRTCFEYILIARGYKKVYLPYYTCEVLLEPLHRQNVQYEFYHINEYLEPTELPILKCGEAFVYTNYYGLKQGCIERLSKCYSSQLIVDNAQAFFAPPIVSIDTFYSARKFFGVPNGAYLYTTERIDKQLQLDDTSDCSGYLIKRYEKGPEAAYEERTQAETEMSNQEIKLMSKFSNAVLSSIDYTYVKNKLVENFFSLNEALERFNRLSKELLDISCCECTPMTYPLLLDKGSLVRRTLIKAKIFIPTFWPNVRIWCKPDSLEYKLTDNMLLLPIDQRYSKDDMNRIIDEICKGV